jgi:hypothetical protein
MALTALINYFYHWDVYILILSVCVPFFFLLNAIFDVLPIIRIRIINAIYNPNNSKNTIPRPVKAENKPWMPYQITVTIKNIDKENSHIVKYIDASLYNKTEKIEVDIKSVYCHGQHDNTIMEIYKEDKILPEEEKKIFFRVSELDMKSKHIIHLVLKIDGKYWIFKNKVVGR